MSTNYYAEVTNNHGDVINAFHLGKRSAGWKFVFSAQEGHFSFIDELEIFLKTTPVNVFSEYGDTIGPMEFLKMATTWWNTSEQQGHTIITTEQKECAHPKCKETMIMHGPGVGMSRESYQDNQGHQWSTRSFC